MSFVDLIFLIGNILCLFSAGVILFRVNTNRIFSVYLLVAYLILNGITNGFYLLISYGYINEVPLLYKMPAPLTFLIGPAAYIHLRAMLYSEKRFNRWDVIHFIPFLVFAVNYMPFYLMPLSEKADLVSRVVADMSLTYTNQDGILPEWINIVSRAILSLVYLFAQWRLIGRFYKKYSLNGKHFLKIKKWAYTFTWAQTGYWGALLVVYLINGLSTYLGASGIHGALSGVVSVLMALFFFVLAGYLLMNPNIMLGLNMNLSSTFSKSKDATAEENLDNYSEKHFSDIAAFLEKKEHLTNPQTNISAIATHCKISPRNISIAISDQGYENFNEYINLLRVKMASEKLMSTDLKQYSIEAIAMSCGFNSKATFYRAFKAEYLLTPTEYMKQNGPAANNKQQA